METQEKAPRICAELIMSLVFVTATVGFFIGLAIVGLFGKKPELSIYVGGIAAGGVITAMGVTEIVRAIINTHTYIARKMVWDMLKFWTGALLTTAFGAVMITLFILAIEAL